MRTKLAWAFQLLALLICCCGSESANADDQRDDTSSQGAQDAVATDGADDRSDLPEDTSSDSAADTAADSDSDSDRVADVPRDSVTLPDSDRVADVPRDSVSLPDSDAAVDAPSATDSDSDSDRGFDTASDAAVDSDRAVDRGGDGELDVESDPDTMADCAGDGPSDFGSEPEVDLDPDPVTGWDNPPRPVNSDDNPGQVNPHSNSGGRRMVRINDATIVITPGAWNESTYRSTDNGLDWTRIDQDGSANGGTLTSGPDEMVYHFYRRNEGHLYLVRFAYDAAIDAIPAPVSIHSFAGGSDVPSEYRVSNATADHEGNLYVAAHWGEPDDLYVLVSSDAGDTWAGPYPINDAAGPWFYPHLDCTSAGRLVAVYSRWGEPSTVMFAASDDRGQTWTNGVVGLEVSPRKVRNPSLLPIGDQTLYVFAQADLGADEGLVFKRSQDGGATWSDSWQLIDPTCGYADPSPALASNGTIYVAYRSNNGTGVTSGGCGSRSRERLARSSDDGASWQFVDDYYDAERTGTRFQMRYQTFWNYGGPLEWIWMQYEDGGTNRPIYYDINTEVTIQSTSAALE